MGLDKLKGKLIAVLGYGLEGKAITKYLLKHGVKPVLFDQRPWENWDQIEKLEIKKLGLNFIFGPDCFMELAGFDVVFRSPGISGPKFKTYLSDFAVITSQTKWFFEHCPAKTIGVTGTKGKGTTASLIFEILKKNFQFSIFNLKTNLKSKILNHKPVIYLTGNIGKIQPLDFLDDLKPDDYVIYELSSFQLQDLTLSPYIAVVLMTTSEHLDYHKDEKEYVEAKSSITKFQSPEDFAVINSDYENSGKIGEQGEGKKFYFSGKQELRNGCFIKNGCVVHIGAGLKTSPTEEILKTADLQLKGAHNLENVCAAVSVGKIIGIDNNIIREAVINFKGLKHRLEFVTDKNGIKFYNDSFSTTPETAIAAIKSFTEPEIVILGGSSKNSDFTGLGKTVVAAKNIKALILVGEEAVKIKNSIHKAGIFSGIISEDAKNMAEIFRQIESVAKSGDVVLLSPGCASFDLFKNYKDRGEQFKKFAKTF